MYSILKNEGNILAVQLSGSLTDAEYDILLPLMEERIKQYGLIRILAVMEDFTGWNISSVWKEISFDFEHNADIERIAVVGDALWEEWLTEAGALFFKGEVRYFDHARLSEAWAWIEGDQTKETAQ